MQISSPILSFVVTCWRTWRLHNSDGIRLGVVAVTPAVSHAGRHFEELPIQLIRKEHSPEEMARNVPNMRRLLLEYMIIRQGKETFPGVVHKLSRNYHCKYASYRSSLSNFKRGEKFAILRPNSDRARKSQIQKSSIVCQTCIVFYSFYCR